MFESRTKRKRYSKQQIRNIIYRAITEEKGNDEIRDQFLTMKMSNDLEDDVPLTPQVGGMFDIKRCLVEKGIIEEEDFITRLRNFRFYKLEVRLSPSCILYGRQEWGKLEFKVNNNDIRNANNAIYTRGHIAEDVAMWIVRQKENLDRYMEEWENVYKTVNKEIKSINMSKLAIKAIVTDYMKDYPNIKYEFIEQKRKMRIKVNVNSKIVYIDGWWKSYKRQLPAQLDNLMKLIEAN